MSKTKLLVPLAVVAASLVGCGSKGSDLPEVRTQVAGTTSSASTTTTSPASRPKNVPTKITSVQHAPSAPPTLTLPARTGN